MMSNADAQIIEEVPPVIAEEVSERVANYARIVWKFARKFIWAFLFSYSIAGLHYNFFYAYQTSKCQEYQPLQVWPVYEEYPKFKILEIMRMTLIICNTFIFGAGLATVVTVENWVPTMIPYLTLVTLSNPLFFLATKDIMWNSYEGFFAVCPASVPFLPQVNFCWVYWTLLIVSIICFNYDLRHVQLFPESYAELELDSFTRKMERLLRDLRVKHQAEKEAYEKLLATTEQKSEEVETDDPQCSKSAEASTSEITQAVCSPVTIENPPKPESNKGTSSTLPPEATPCATSSDIHNVEQNLKSAVFNQATTEGTYYSDGKPTPPDLQPTEAGHNSQQSSASNVPSLISKFKMNLQENAQSKGLRGDGAKMP